MVNLGFLYYKILNNRILDYLVFFGIFFVCVFALKILQIIILDRLKKYAKRTKNIIDDYLFKSIERKLIPLFYFLSFYFSLRILKLVESTQNVINIIAWIVITIFGVRFFLSLIVYGLETYWLRKEKDIAKTKALNGVILVIKFAVWCVAVIILFDNLGIKISPLVAGLGIGGIAIALAAQAILGDLFSYFTIFFDRPFEIGDFINVDDYFGTVEHIGIKTTRVRSLGGEQLVFSNTDLTNSRVRNYKKMEKRRIVFKLGVTYGTVTKKLQAIPEIIKKIIADINGAIFDRAHFVSFGDFSLDYEIVYFVNGSDYYKYMDIQQEINFKIKTEFEKRKIEFAFPTQTLYLEK